MSHNHPSEIFSALTAEHSALVNFIALLEREQGMLVENSTDRLPAVSEQKSIDALRLNKLGEARRSLLRNNIPELSVDAIHAWLTVHGPQSLAVWQEIRALAERAQQINRTNGELIQMKLRHNQQLLTVLNSSVNKANIYGPDGQQNLSLGSGRSLGSG